MRVRGRLFLDPFWTECLTIVLYLYIRVSLQALLIMDQITFWSPTPRNLHPARTSTKFLNKPLNAALTTTNAGIDTLIEYLPDHKLLICTQCKVAVPSNDLEIHLRSSHRGTKKAWRDSLHEKFEQLPTIQTTADLQPLPDGSPPLSFLIPPREGYRCPHCAVFRTLHETELRRHSSKAHNLKIKPSDVEKHVCYLQGWIKRHVVQAKRYWVVDMDAASVSCCEGQHSEPTEIVCGAEAELLKLETEEETRIRKDPEVVIDEDLETDENSDWLRACGWAIWFKHKPIPLLVAAASVPFPGCPRVLYLGKWHGVECTSPISVERTLQLVALVSQAAIDRCVSTLRKTPRTLRCWARTWGQSFSPYPLECPQPSSLRKYIRIWTSAICYFFRVWDQGHRLKETTVDLGGIDFTVQQRAAMQLVWSHLEPLGSHEGLHIPSELPIEGIEAVTQLFMTFWTETPRNADLQSTAIARFSGILGIHPHEFSFRRAYDYTPLLSALIWVGQLLFLEYALPLEAYDTLPQRWPARDEYPDIAHRLRYTIKPRYMERGSMAPLGYLIERRQHGRAIARREGPQTNIDWSKDGHELKIDESSITVPQFRQVVRSVIARCQHLLDDLLFHWWPEIDLNLKDDMANQRPGYSFLSDPANHLQGKFRILSQHIFTEVGGLSWSSATQLSRYLRECDRFVQHLFVAIHTTSGMPARGEELRTIRWANTMAIARSIVCFQGRLVLIFPYNKACTNTNNSFYVVRSPCPAVERMLFVFLVYLRPLRDMIARKLLFREANTDPNRHVFSKHDQMVACFKPSDCLRSLRVATVNSPLKMTMRNYRQISVAMSKRHMPDLLQPFDPHTPNDLNGMLHLLSFQTGHKPSTHAGAYALERGFPSKLQPDLIHRYIENSDLWQKFLLITKDDFVETEMESTLVIGSPSFLRRKQAILGTTCDNSTDITARNVMIQSGTTTREATENKKRKTEESLSPTSRKIRSLQRDLETLIASRKTKA